MREVRNIKNMGHAKDKENWLLIMIIRFEELEDNTAVT